MGRHQRVGLLLVAAFVLNAIAVTSASASTPRVTAGEYPAAVSAEQVAGKTNELSLEGGRKVNCTSAKYTTEYTEAQSEAPTWSIELSPVFEGCTATILGNVTQATVTTNSCKLTLNSETTVSTTEQKGSGNINCPGSPLEIHVWQTEAKHLGNETALCTYAIGHQASNVSGATGKLISSTELEVVVSPTAFSVSRTSGTLTNCGAASQSGGMKTTVKAKAKHESTQLNLAMDDKC